MRKAQLRRPRRLRAGVRSLRQKACGVLRADFDACQVLTWKGNGGPGHRAIMSSSLGPRPSGKVFNVRLGPRRGGAGSTADPALGCGHLGG